MDKLTIEQLISNTNKVKEENRKKEMERINIGRKEAIETIVKDCENKMLESSLEGFDKAILYSFEWVSDPKATTDSKGVKTVFGENVRLLDLIKKSKDEFIKDLNSFFNKDGETKFHCGFFRKMRENDNMPDIWNIYVSWAPIFTRHSKESNDKETCQDNPPLNNGARGFGKNQGRGFGRTNGRETPYVQRIPNEYSSELLENKEQHVPKGFAPPRILNRKAPI